MVDSARRGLVIGLSGMAVAAFAAPFAIRYLARRPHMHAGASAAPFADAAGAHAIPFRQPLRIPGRDGLLAEVALSAPLTLRAQTGAFAVFDGAPTTLWHYAGGNDGRTFANPLLRVTQGELVDVTLDNHLREATTLHWHGLLVDEINDGSGLHPVAEGARARCRYRMQNRAGLYWYHAHPHHRTGFQLQYGLAGPLLVDDAEELALRERLGLAWGVRDVPLFIADKQVDAGNAIVYKQGADDWIGNRVLVNWTPEPYFDVVQGLYRFRIANACNARLLRLAFVHDDQLLPYQLIGTDGGLLRQPWQVEHAFLAPAQRIDVLVDFSGVPADGRVLLRSLDYVPMENEDESGAFMADPMGDHPGAVPMGGALDLMQFCIAGCGDGVPIKSAPTESRPIKVDARAESMRVPSILSALEPPPDTQGWPVRSLRLRMDEAGAWFINDWNMFETGHAPAFTVKRGSREVWEIRNNMTSMPHPIHVHGVQFRVVSRSISPADVRSAQVAAHGLGPQDLGLNDTVLVWPGEIVRIAMDFSQPFRGPQRYMLHCHNLEHEDMGMMVTFAVDD